jgi:hypothetical protein
MTDVNDGNLYPLSVAILKGLGKVQTVLQATATANEKEGSQLVFEGEANGSALPIGQPEYVRKWCYNGVMR